MSFKDQIRVTVNYDQIFSDQPFTEEQIRENLSVFNPVNVNIILTKFGLFNSHKMSRSSLNHFAILSQLLDEERASKLQIVLRESDGADQIIFNEFSLMALLKINNEVTRSGGYEIDHADDRLLFAKILLSMNSIVFHNNMDGDIKESIRYEHARQFLSVGEGEAINILTRIDYMGEFIEADYPRVGEIFKQATGLDMRAYCQLVFCLFPGWVVNHEPEKIDDVVMRDYEKYFSSISFSKEVIERFVGLISVNRDEFANLNSQYTSKARIKDSMWNYLIFFNKPLLREKNFLLCPNPQLLALVMFEGVYNIVRSYMDDHGIAADLPDIWGKIYERYVLEVLRSTFGGALSENIIVNGRSSIDAVVELNDTVLLIEIKYCHWRYGVRMDPTIENLKEHLGKINRYNPWADNKGRKKTDKKGFGQIKDFYLKYKDGNTGQFDFTNKQIIPVLVLGEAYPFDPLNRELLEAYLEKEGCLIDFEDNVLPPVLLTTNEVELLEGMIENVSLNKFLEVFRKYAYSYRERGGYFGRPTTFNNLVIEEGHSFRNSKRMRQRLDYATKDIPSFFNEAK